MMHLLVEAIRIALLKAEHVFTVGRVDDMLVLRLKNGDRYQVRFERIS